MGSDHCPDRLIAEIAAHQHGVMSGRQMQWAGLTADTVGRRVRRARIFRIGWMSYSFLPTVDERGTAVAALLSAGADRHLDDGPSAGSTPDDARYATRFDGAVVLSHWSSLRLQRVAPSQALLPVDVTVVGRGVRPRSTGLRGHRLSRLAPSDVVLVEGMPCTTAARAILDIAPSTGHDRLRRLIREAQFLGLLDEDVLTATCARIPWHAGVRALADADPDLRLRLTGDSPLAGDLGVFLEHQTALGPWVPQHPVVVAGHSYRLDFAVPELRLAAEADGGGAHEQSQGRSADGRRDATLLTDGWLTVRVTDARLRFEADDLRTTLHAIAARRGWAGPPDGWVPRPVSGRRRGVQRR